MRKIHKWWVGLKEEFEETRLDVSEDMLEWFIKRKMSWGYRWLVAIVLFVCYRLSLISPLTVVWFFYFLLCLALVIVLWKWYAVCKERKRKKRDE